MYSPLVERLQSKPQSLQSLDGSKITQNEWQKEVALEQLFPKGNRIPRLRFHAQTHFHKREREGGKGFSGKQRVGCGAASTVASLFGSAKYREVRQG